MAHEASSGQDFRPYVPADQDIPEFTPKAIILGAFFGILFGAATVYLALRAGLTVSASVPIAVLSIAFFKKFGKSTILENNIVQTIGSAGESVAAGVVFTTPALIFLAGGDQYFKYIQITILAIFGGILGVLFMIPLRRALIVKEHGKLRYPEGVACADVLIAGEKGGNLAKMVFAGFWVALGYKILYGVFGFWRETATFFRTKKESVYPSSTLNVDVTPEYLDAMGAAQLEGLMTTQGTAITKEPYAADFLKRFQERTKISWTVHDTTSVYSQSWIIKEALEKAASADPKRLRDAISSLHITRPPPTAFNGSEIKFDPNGQNTLAPPFIVQWQNGLPVLVTPADVAVAQLKWPS
jgi:hypothetical protein